MLVELFERVTLQPFTDTPGSHLTSRIRSMGRILRDILATSGSSFSPPLETSKTTCRTGDYTTLNRFPQQPCTDVSSWRRRVCQSEQYQTPQLRPRQIVAGQDNCLHLWVRGHQRLLPTDVVAEWESSAALLLLWEVDHGQDWPTMASQRSGALAGFTKKLQQQVGRDDELKAWFTPRELQRPLAPGLADTHQLFWPVRVRPPAPMEPQGWYTDLTARWRAYISALAVPLGVAVTAAAPPASNARRVRRRLTGTTSTTVSPSVADDVGVSSTTPSASAASSGVRARSADSGVGAQAPKRQRTMLLINKTGSDKVDQFGRFLADINRNCSACNGIYDNK